MVSSLLLALHLVATDPAKARASYMACLSAFARQSAEQRLTKEAFDTALASACKTEEAAFRKMSVDFDVSRGIGRKISEEGVGDEIRDIQLSARERFDLESEAPPPPE